jgi:UDP-N-acetylmuramoyl-tripeptide--D-alanyl-D-alanine ligase
MKPISTIADVVEATKGTLKAGSASRPVAGVVIDSRKAAPGNLFIAIRGEHFDGHWFVEEVYRAGAMAAVIEPEIIIFELPLLPPDFVIVEVRNTLVALRELAVAHRRGLNMKTVGVTGSNGKTSVKDFIATIAAGKFKVASTAGNYNNHIGVPLSVLSAKPDTEVGVFEVGMNHAGEIAPLAQIIAPDIAVITNIGVAHVEHLGSRDAICEEKLELARALPESGVLIFDAEDEFAGRLNDASAVRKITIGFEKGDIRATNIRPLENGVAFDLTDGTDTHPVQLQAHGTHMVRNALLASAASTALGISLQNCALGLAGARLPKGRLQRTVISGVTIFDDTYNANPDSMEAALRVIADTATQGKRIAVLGTMGELGAYAEEGHQRVGTACGDAKIGLLIAVGDFSKVMTEAAAKAGVAGVHSVETPEQAVALLRANVQVGDVMLVKGSRSAQMEKVIEGLSS